MMTAATAMTETNKNNKSQFIVQILPNFGSRKTTSFSVKKQAIHRQSFGENKSQTPHFKASEQIPEILRNFAQTK